MKSINIWAIGLFFCLFPLTAEPWDWDLFLHQGLSGNSTLSGIERDLEKAEENLLGPILIEKSSLNLNSGWDLLNETSQPGQSSGEQWSGSAALNIPVMEQLSLGASVDQEGASSFSLKVSPFAGTTAAAKSQSTVLTLGDSLERSSDQLGETLFIQALNYILQQQENQLLVEELSLREEQYKAALALYNMGRIDYSDLQKQSDSLTEANLSLLQGEQDLINSEETLRNILGPDWGELDFPVPSLEQVESWLSRRTGELESLGLATPASAALLQLEQEKSLTQAEKRLTPIFEPNLDVSLTGQFSDSTKKVALNLSLSLSQESFQKSERLELSEEIAQLEQEIRGENYNLILQIQGLNRNLEAQTRALELAQSQEQQQSILYQESLLLYKNGDMNALELEESRLDWMEKQWALYKALWNLLKIQGDLLLLY